MEYKTQVTAPEGTQQISVERIFHLPLELLFKAYEESELIEQWMHTQALEHQARSNGSYCFQTSDPEGNPVFKAFGVYHAFEPRKRIVRTFEMDNLSMPAQLEFLHFTAIDAQTSRLEMQMIFQSAAARDGLMKMPFARGLHMAHNRIQQLMNPIK